MSRGSLPIWLVLIVLIPVAIGTVATVAASSVAAAEPTDEERRVTGLAVLVTSTIGDGVDSIGVATPLVALAVLLLSALYVFRGRGTESTPPIERETGDAGAHPDVPDTECIKQLVIDNGGRMRQAAIVERVDWSKAKVSRLLSELEAEGEITKLRLGRENLICIRGHEPAATRSSHRRSQP